MRSFTKLYVHRVAVKLFESERRKRRRLRRKEALGDVRRARSSRKGLGVFLWLVLTWISGEEATGLISPSLAGRRMEEQADATAGNGKFDGGK